jgi:DNA-directed RNA polymerase subunit alpha
LQSLQEDISSAVETIYLSSELGQFEIEPLASGFGLTVGNALRRVLLSSLTGAAITAIRIENVYHEFSTVPGVREDTTELILNLKQVRMRSYTEEAVNVRLESSGPGVVTAGDIQVPPEIEIVNPEIPIATLDGADARLDVLLTIEKGHGYLTADGREPLELGAIPIDAVFTPIRRVNYRVEKTRVGARTDYDKLLLEIQTDGSISPTEALSEAAQILISHFQIFAHQAGPGPLPGAKSIAPSIPSRAQDMPIEVLDLSSRTYNCLKRSQITTVGQILTMSEDELLGLRNFGQKSLLELYEKLAEHGIVTSGDMAARRAGVDDEDEELDEELDEEEEGTPRAGPRGGRTAAIAEDEDFDDEDFEDEARLARTRSRRRPSFQEEAMDDDDLR